MKQHDVFVAFVSWGEGGKHRPVLLYEVDGKFAKVHPITTKYDGKSAKVKSKYFKINDWVKAGLHKQSYVDVGVHFDFPMSALGNVTPIGVLSESDIERLIEFLEQPLNPQ
ncbi:MAG: hypothetical protein FWG83_05380 [Oscillospiraceae bacterium]|nr:hypothetical protein [Oscillospiraceae bacterium]